MNLIPLRALGLSVLAQLIGVALGLALLKAGLSEGFALLAQATCAWIISVFLSLPIAWQILNLIIGPALIASMSVVIPAWIFGLISMFLLLIYVPTFWTRVPFYPTPPPVYQSIANLLPKDRPFQFIDLGCGFGTMLAVLAKQFPNGNFVGIELGILPYLLTKLRSLFHPNLKAIFGDFWKLDFAQYDFVYAFLAPPPMAAIEELVLPKLGPNSLLIVNSFPLPVSKPKIIEVSESRGGTLYLYKNILG